MSKSISFLLGAGFSYPMGYPIGNSMEDRLNDAIDNYIQEFNAAPRKETLDRFPFVLREMMACYKESHNNTFDYERFFEYIPNCCFDERITNARNKYHYKHQYSIEYIALDIQDDYLRYTSDLIKDEKGKQFYNEQDTEQLSKYEQFIDSLKELLERGYDINIHTLNHDLLFESFKNSPVIGGDICDGFDCENSPYKGNIGKEWVTLPYYTGKYDKRIKLYKLHGSIDQYAYYEENENFKYDNHIKVYENVSNWEFKKNDGTYHFPEWHPDFLTGVKSKERKYNSYLYQVLFPKFVDDLKSADCLIIIGYGAKDNRINELIVKNFNYSNKSCFIYDPYPNEILEGFANNIKKEITRKCVEEFELPNF